MYIGIFTRNGHSLALASVGFANATYLVNEGEGSVEVCVEAEGYGFTIDMTVRNITASGTQGFT